MNKKILLCGNPNVGKSTIFNELTSSSEYENNLKKNNNSIQIYFNPKRTYLFLISISPLYFCPLLMYN